MDKWDERFMAVATVVSSWSSCLRRHVGAVIVKDKRVVATGYNGAPQGKRTCVEAGECIRDMMGIPSGTRSEVCWAVHAEQNAVAQAAKLGTSTDGATIYCAHQPCSTCAKILINAGIKRVVYREEYPEKTGLNLLKSVGIAVDRMPAATEREVGK